MFAKRMFVSVLVSLAAAVFSATPAVADMILYSDGFSRTGALNGTAPETDAGQYGASAGATWISSGTSPSVAWTTDGSKAVGDIYSAGGTARTAANLPFSPQTGHVYTLSATVQCTAATNASNWMEVALSTNADLAALSSDQYAFALFVYSSGNNQSFLGSGTGGEVDIGSDKGSIQWALVLDTNPTHWTVTWKVNGVTERGPVAWSSNPTLNYISFYNSGGTTCTVDNFLVSVDVPEPSTLALLAAGLVGLLCYAWRKRR